MAELKTKINDASVIDFINKVEDTAKKADSLKILEMMKSASGLEPKMWGDSIIGFGTYHYKSKSGSEGDWFVLGFSPRKQNISLYVLHYGERDNVLLEKLGKFKTGAGCLYIKRLSDVDESILIKLIENAAKRIE